MARGTGCARDMRHVTLEKLIMIIAGNFFFWYSQISATMVSDQIEKRRSTNIQTVLTATETGQGATGVSVQEIPAVAGKFVTTEATNS